jgi:hypothetical protein
MPWILREIRETSATRRLNPGETAARNPLTAHAFRAS